MVPLVQYPRDSPLIVEGNARDSDEAAAGNGPSACDILCA